MLQRILLTAVIAGFVAGISVSLVQMVRVIPLIELAVTAEMATHAHEDGNEGQQGLDHDGALTPQDGLQRTAFTFLVNSIAGVGFGLLLAAAFTLRGAPMNIGQGVLWGIAGFTVFSLAPALGLPPSPPGIPKAPLIDRQTWWLGTAAATGLGLAMAVFAKAWVYKALGALFLAAPHIVGAPVPDAFTSSGLAAIGEFAVASLTATGIFWIVLGGFSGFLFRRFA